MPTATENRQPAPLSPLKRLVVRQPVAAFLVMLYAIAWGVFLPVVLQARGLLALPVDLSEGFAFDAVTSPLMPSSHPPGRGCSDSTAYCVDTDPHMPCMYE